MLRLSVLALTVSMSVAAFAAPQKNEPIQPIEPAVVTSQAKVELGKQLFFDPRLSKSGFISCNSCHNLSMGGSDNLPSSIGHNWQEGPINSPTVLNSSLNLAQFWDGRAADLKEQAGGPIANPMEMGFVVLVWEFLEPAMSRSALDRLWRRRVATPDCLRHPSQTTSTSPSRRMSLATCT